MTHRGFYVPLAVDTMDDSRIIDAGPDAELLWYRLLQFVKRKETHGLVSTGQVLRLHPKGKAPHAALVSVGLLRPAGEEMWALAGWFTWNETPEQIEQARQRKVRAGRKGAATRWRNDGEAMAGAIQLPSDSHGDGMADGWHVPWQTDSRAMANDGYNDNDNDNDNESAIESVGTSSVLSLTGSAPRLRHGEPAPLTTSLAGLLGRMG